MNQPANRTSDYMPFDEFKRFLKCLRKDKEYAFEAYALLAFYTATRVSDTTQIQWKDVVGRNAIHIREKKRKKLRKITFTSQVQAKIMELYELLGQPDLDTYILTSPVTLLPYTRQGINAKLKVFKRKYSLKIKQFSTHSFRKTFGRHVYESSGKSAESLVLLNQILRHSSIEDTKIYIGITEREVQKVYENIAF